MNSNSLQKTWTYLDNNATTRVDEPVLGAMLPFLSECYANASAIHGMGTESANAVAVAREQICALLHAQRESEIIFTSGGSESNNTAILSALESQTGRNEIITSAVEHASVLAVCAFGKNRPCQSSSHSCGSLRESTAGCLSLSTERQDGARHHAVGEQRDRCDLPGGDSGFHGAWCGSFVSLRCGAGCRANRIECC